VCATLSKSGYFLLSYLHITARLKIVAVPQGSYDFLALVGKCFFISIPLHMAVNATIIIGILVGIISVSVNSW
jgi:hypothetical protein